MSMIARYIGDVAFEGASAAYIRQQVELALKPLASLKKLGKEAEAQALLVVGSAIANRIEELRKDADQ